MKLSLPTRLLHWSVAIFMLGMLPLGIVMKYTEWYAVYDLHKSLGILGLFIVLPRVIWRLKQGWPAPMNTRVLLEQQLAKAVHWFLLLGTLLMPVTGLMLSGGSGHGFGVFGLTLLPSNHSLANPSEVMPYNEVVASLGYALHQWLGFAMVAVIALHIAGALKHHFVYQDDTLKRMMLFKR